MTKIITYSLQNNQNNSDAFYKELSHFTDAILPEAYTCFGKTADSFYKYVKDNHTEDCRTKDEYILELVFLGIFLENYLSKARQTQYLPKKVLKLLYLLRKKFPKIKLFIDKLRGVLGYLFLEKQKRQEIDRYSGKDLELLLQWMGSTGEFQEELKRLKLWKSYLDYYYKPREISGLLSTAVQFSKTFSLVAHSYLGKYTNNISNFWNQNAGRYKFKEDYFFVARKENEYFLNMFGAEIMNRELRLEFEATLSKAVLLPTCMRNTPQEKCKATSDGKELVCMQCNPQCNIGRISSEMRVENIKTYLIPHSSDFSKFLVKWKDNKSTGLIGVACVLNLLTGGYEMRRLNIPSQCVFLDYCGCKKHWDTQGTPTDLNIKKLKEIAQIKSNC